MAYSPRTGLVYIPVTESSTGFQSAVAKDFQVKDRVYNTGTVSFSDKITSLYGQPGAPARGNIRSYLEAYDPVTQKIVWKAPDKDYGAHGALATASDLIFSGDWSGRFNAFDAKTGAKLWSAPTQADVVAAPSTYTIKGVQYVALLVGARGLPPGQVRTNPSSANNSRLLVFKLGGDASLPTTAIAGSVPGKVLAPPLLTGTNEQVIDGEGAYGRFCAGCHGAGGVADKSIPDLRYSPALGSLRAWNTIVVDGARADKGMVSFKKVLAEGQAEAIYHYIVSQANKEKAAEQAKR
jgi:alcohol dehydrogenase (cytochrome c)/quinohemoprotein ethanol dehydrogenase